MCYCADAESVRLAESKAGVPFERAWACERQGEREATRDGDLIVVESRFTAPITLGDVQRMEADSAWCLETNEATHLEAYLSRDGLRMVCLFLAPDAEVSSGGDSGADQAVGSGR